MNTIKERIIESASYYGISIRKFEEKCQLNRGVLSNMGENSSLGSDKLACIFDNCTEISPDWLITGRGEMLRKGSQNTQQIGDIKGKNSQVIQNVSGSIDNSQVQINQGKDTRKIGHVAINAENEPEAIYLYDISASAGYGSFDEMISQEKIIGKYVVPDFRNIDWMIYVKGSSMYPKYSSGDIIACRVLHESRFIQWGKVYVVATREQGILVKRLKKSEMENCIAVVSDNPNYDPFDIPNDEILGIALVVGVIRME